MCLNRRRTALNLCLRTLLLTSNKTSPNLHPMVKRHSQQLSLPLRPKARWGGRREGAGRKPGPNPLVRHRSRTRFPGRSPCHVTLRVREDVPSLRSVRLVREFERSLGRACERGDFRVVHYSLLGNHAHLIVEAKDRDALGRGMIAVGARLARAANRVFERRGRVLEERYHLRVLRTPLEVRRAIRYVLLNAPRHARKTRGDTPRVDPASSGRWFDGWKRGLVRRDLGPASVSPPHTWLLRTGWRPHGLLHPEDIPGDPRASPAPG